MVMVWRALFIWLLVLAVPVQGLAAALMVSCGSHQRAGAMASLLPAHMGQAATAAHRLGSAHAPGVQGDAAAAPCPHQAQHAGAGGTGEAAAGTADAAAPASIDGHTCSACAACCSVGAPQALALAVPAAAGPGALSAAVQAAVDRFAADGLERPPRAMSA